ncbi:hypothetical protein E4U56_007620 [Claviceps arundinis]|uniref:Uncharacterized protein n=1 Tax=Claviceps arundinis TaxID=1623583 RepID=A0A9P7MUI6_9HYPO|nr:hypothetical protein E4U56_007620 [Claviceps arundinis]
MTRCPSPSRPRSASQAQKYMASRAGSPSRTRLSNSSSSPSSHGSPEQQEKQRKRDLLKDSAGLLLGIGVAVVVAHKVLPKDKDADPVHDNTQDWARDRHIHIHRHRHRDRDRDANGRTYRERRTDGEHAPKKKPSGNSSGSLLVERAEKSPHGGHPSGDIGTGRRAPIRGQDLECSALKREDGGLLRLGGKRGACESPRRTYPDVELVAVRTITTAPAPALALALARESKREDRMGERGIPGHRSAERHQRSREAE